MLVFNLCLKNHPPHLLKTTESIFPLHNIVPRDFACISDNQPRMTLSVDVQKRCKVVCTACFLGKFFMNLCCRRQILLSAWIHKDIFDWQHSGHSTYKILATKTDRVDNSPGQAWREREFCHLATEGGNISTPVKRKTKENKATTGDYQSFNSYEDKQCSFKFFEVCGQNILIIFYKITKKTYLFMSSSVIYFHTCPRHQKSKVASMLPKSSSLLVGLCTEN